VNFILPNYYTLFSSSATEAGAKGAKQHERPVSRNPERAFAAVETAQ
jgi:hypothetical protein